MIRIQQQPVTLSERAATIIAWVHLAGRPLEMNALVCSLAVKDGDSHFNPRGMPIRETLLNCCHGLVVMDRETSTVRLVHYSLQEYLLQQKKIFDLSEEQWHSKIACTCLTFLKISPLITSTSPVITPYPSSFSPFTFSSLAGGDNGTAGALLAYAATQWGHHLRASGQCPGTAFELCKEFLDGRWPNISTILELLYRKIKHGMIGYSKNVMLSTHIAAFFGLEKIILHLRESGFDLNRKDEFGYTPLFMGCKEWV